MDEDVRLALERQNPWWFGRPFDTGIDRLSRHPRLSSFLKAKEALVLVGVRRAGKSTLLRQLVKGLLDGGTPRDSILLASLDEPVLRARGRDPSLLAGLVDDHRARREGRGTLYLFLDEVQACEHWAAAVKSLCDTGVDVKLVLTGSTSALLDEEVVARLAGRCLRVVVHPLSFPEYLDFKGVHEPTTAERLHHFGEYLERGGFPRIALEPDPEVRRGLLAEYLETIYLRDIVLPGGIRNGREVFDLLYLVLSSVGSPLSCSRAARALGLATDTVREYISCAERAFLVGTLSRYDPSVRRQLANPRKTYCVDTGLVSALSFSFSENRGRLLENLVYIELRRRGAEVYYHRGRHECDFLVRDGSRVIGAIQVALTLRDEATRKRELRGLAEAMEAHGLGAGLVLTERERETLDLGGRRVDVMPVHEWLEGEAAARA